MSTYIRRNSTDQGGHQYRVLNVDGTSLYVTARHSKDCAQCVVVRSRITPRHQRLPETVDMSGWVHQTLPTMERTRPLLQQALDASQAGNVPALCALLQQVGTMMQTLPASPDGGLESEYLAQAGDAYCDAAAALQQYDTEAAGDLVTLAEQLTDHATRGGVRSA